MKKIVIKKLGLLLIFLLGCLVFTYPFYSNAANYFIDQYRLKELAKREQIENSQKENQMKKKNNAIKVNGLVVQHDPFDASQVDTTSIDLKEHLIGSVSIPKIDVSIPLFDTITNQILENGAGVLQGTSMPTGGKGTHSVISAHRGLAERLLFRHLDQLKKEDFFLVESVGKTLAYEVVEIRTVKPDETDFLKLEPESDLVTLLTCTPYMINSHRLIVTGKRIPVTDEMKKEANASQKKFKWQQAAIIVGIGLFLLGSIFVSYRLIVQYLLSKKYYEVTFYVSQTKKLPIVAEEFIIYRKNSKKPLKRNGQIVVLISQNDGKIGIEKLPGGQYDLALRKNPKKILGTFGVTSLKEKKMKWLKTKNKSISVIQKNHRIRIVLTK